MIPPGAFSPWGKITELGKGGMMTHIETTRVNEMLGLQIGVVREFLGRLNTQDLEQLDKDVTELGVAVRELKEMLASLPHH
jgi:hypothetical protein